jgi:hypothetical protein
MNLPIRNQINKNKLVRTMRYLVLLFMIAACSLYPQPLSGSYTVGGTSPNFTTLQDASNALKLNGVSGPVFFNIRPGIYMKNGGNNTVLILDSIITGLSELNRVTFQPDAGAGGNVGNTILQMNITNTSTADPQLVLIKLDFISFKNITFQESDASVNTGTLTLVQLVENSLLGAPPVSGIVFEGCRFIGTDPTAGTENGIELGGGVRDITIRGNTFLRLLRGISGSNTSISAGSMIIEDNQFLEGWRSSSGSGNPLGSAMEIHGQHLLIRKNIIDFNGSFNGGYRGISILSTSLSESIIIKQNSIEGPVSACISVTNNGGVDSFLIANNMINADVYAVWANEPAFGINASGFNNAKILFNTIVVRGSSVYGLFIGGSGCTVLNNIIIAYPTGGFSVCYFQNPSTNLQSDYNVLLTTNNPPLLVVCSAGHFFDLLSYQVATGLDTNSISKDIDFIDSSDVHISDCQAQDPDLDGIPVAGISVDIDDEIRSTTTPMIGADENGFSSHTMFGKFLIPLSNILSGTAFSVATGDYDEDGDDDIVVPNYDDREIFIRNNTSGAVTGHTLHTIGKPVIAKFYDFDEDGHLDVIAGDDSTAVEVFWGDGAGGFSSPVLVGTFGRVRSLEPGPTFTGDIHRTIMITEDNGFGSNSSTIGYLMHLGNRVLCHDVQYDQGNIPPDTIDAVMTDFVTGDFAGDGGIPEIAAVTSFPLPHPLVIDNDIVFLGSAGTPCADVVPRGTFSEHLLGTGVGSTAGQSNIVSGDFDGDGDLDLITLETFSSILFIKNQGNLNFTSESIPVSGAMGIASMDYENDGDLDFVTVNERLEENGISVFLNNGFGDFTVRENCFFPFASGRPWSVATADFDLDGRMDIAITASVETGIDSLFVLRNLGGGTVGLPDEDIQVIPTEFSISQNYPNPFNPSTKIEYSLPEESNVKITVFNILGEKVRDLVSIKMSAGTHSVNFTANDLVSGIYIYKVEAKTLSGGRNFVAIKKMLLLK